MFNFGRQRVPTGSSEVEPGTGGVLDTAAGQPLGDIYTMPTAFEPNPTPVASPKHWWWIVVTLVFVILVGISLFFYLRSRPPSPSESSVVNQPIEQPTTPPTATTPTISPPSTSEPVAITPVERDRQRYLDVKIIQAALELYYNQQLKYPVALSEVTLGASGASSLSAGGFSDYPQAPVYLTLVPHDPDPTQSFRYASPTGLSYKIAFTLEEGVAGLARGFHYLSPEGFDGLVPIPPTVETQPTESGSSRRQVVLPSPSLDSDSDGLTDVEEALYGTQLDLADSDGDGYSDGNEVVAGYHPGQGSGTKLDDSPLVKRYVSQSFGYSLLYPQAWEQRTVDEVGSEVLFTSATGEFLQVSVQDNPENKTPAEWYASFSNSLRLDEVPTIKLGSQLAARSLDGLNLYLAQAGKLVTIAYNIATHERADWLTTWQMVYQSFALTTTVVPSEPVE